MIAVTKTRTALATLLRGRHRRVERRSTSGRFPAAGPLRP